MHTKNRRQKTGLRLFVWFLTLIVFVLPAMSQEEFNGPLSSWANVKTRFGAKGDGKTDDTKAIQTALDSLSDRQVQFNTGKRGYSVVYIPAGTYKITATLVLRGKIGVRIVGEDPSKTVIAWQGNDKDTLFWANGSAYFYLGRLSWNAGGRKDMEAVGIHWKSRWRDQTNSSSATVNIELSDLIIQEGFSKGIAGGTSEEGVNQNDSEILISRCVFNKCTVAGVAIKGYNALDYWIWYCRFIQCYTGVSCNSGNYHVYNSYFNKSTQADVMNWNSYYTSVRYCYSTGSNCFSMDNGKSSNPFKRIFQHNIILNPTSNPIQYYHTGKVTLIDNYCRVPANSKVTAFLVYDTWAATNYTVLELGNTFENIKNVYTMPVRNYKVYKNKKPRSGKTDTLEKSFLSTFPTTPKLVRRKVYTVPEGATTSAIQSLINKATSLKKRAIVHFPFGLYYLEKELILNKSSDIQIIGDGLIYATMLMRRNNTVYKNGSIFKIYGPSSVSFRDLNIQTVDGKKDSSRAISIVNVDQPGSSLLLDQLYSGMDSTLTVLGYDNLFIQKTNSFFSGGNYLSGGLLQKSGKGNFGMICYAGQFANTQVRNNASFIATDCWWEGDKKKTALDYSGEGTIIIQGAMIAPGNPDSNTTAIRIGKFKGKIGLMDMYVQGKIDVEANNPDLQFLLWNINFYHKKRPLQFVSTRPPSYRSFMGGVSSQCFNPKDPDCQKLINTNDIEVNINIADAGDYIDDFILTLRSARPVLYTQKKAGISNLYFSRVAINSTFLSAIHIDKQ